MASSPNQLHNQHGTSPQLLLGENAATSRSTVGPSAAEWEKVREDIRSLYYNKTLKEVRAIIEKRHNFKATERMYKARLSQWQFNKNSKDKEYQFCAILHRNRRNIGKKSTLFVINGNKRTVKDLRKYIKGRKMSSDEFLDTALKNVSRNQLETQRQVRAVTPATDSASQDLEEDRDGDVEIGLAGGPPTGSFFDMGPSPPTDFNPSPLPATSLQHHDRHSFFQSPTNNNPSVIADFSHFGTHLHSPNSPHLPELHPPFKYRACPPSTPDFGLSQIPLSPTYSGRPYTSNSLSLTVTTATPPLISPFSDMQLPDAPSPRVDQPSIPCQHLNRELDRLGYQTLYTGNLGTIYGSDDLDSWPMISPSPSRSSGTDSSWEFICPKCHEPTSKHLDSLQSWENSPSTSIPQLQLPTPATTATSTATPAVILEPVAPGLVNPSPASRVLFHSTPDLPSPGNTMPLPVTAKENDHSLRWVSRCFLACIYLSSCIPHPSPSSSPITPSQKERHASEALRSADVEFTAMLNQDDPMTILALNQTLSTLMMHDQGAVSRRIIDSAAKVATRVLGAEHPTTVIVRWMVFVAEPEVLLKQREITSPRLREVYDYFVRTYGEKDRRSLGAMYALGFMLNVELQLEECEGVLRRCYDLCCEMLGRKNIAAITVMTNLRLCLERMGRVDEAIHAARIAIHDSAETLGRSHPRRLETMRLLGRMYQSQGQLELCEELYWKVLEGRIRSMGKDHNYTQAMKKDLRRLLRSMGKWYDERAEDWEAEELKCEAAMRIKILWDWDPFDSWASAGVATNGTGVQDVTPGEGTASHMGAVSLAVRMAANKRQTGAY